MKLFVYFKRFWKFLFRYWNWWLIPLLVLILVIGGLLVLSGGTSLSPFLYRQ
jgi:hypothetical protein